MLDVQRIRAGYGRINVLWDVSLSLGEGEFLGVLGHNGMGKSTLIAALMGVLPLTAGTITLEGKAIGRLPAYARARLGVGYVPQGRQIFPRLSVRENLMIAAIANRRGDTAVEEVLADLPLLKPLLDRAGGLLSGGEQQILALGRCLCAGPRVVLLDEPTEGVQPSIVADMADILARLHRERRLSIVLVEQNLDFLRGLSQRVLVLEKGRVTAEIGLGDPSQMDALAAAAGFGGGAGRRAAVRLNGPAEMPGENHA